MCYSAPVSFIASGVLVAAGAGSLKLARKRERLIAAAPVLFGIQQAIEGLQWLAEKPGAWSLALGYAYVFFAFLLWPVYVPFAVYRSERKLARRRLLVVFLVLGAFVSGSLFWLLITQPLAIGTAGGHLVYDVFSSFASGVGAAAYVFVVAGSLFVSSRRAFRWLGFASMASALLAWAVAQAAFVSVWCFFAALLSMGIFFFFFWRAHGSENRLF